MTFEQKVAVTHVLRLRTPLRVHHGACEGADRDFSTLCRQFPIGQTFWPGSQEQWDWAKFAQSEGDAVEDIRPVLQRNSYIVKSSSALLVTPRRSYEVRRSGTWATVRYARKLGRPILVIWPDGRTSKENERA